jgi:hypothetical protein
LRIHFADGGSARFKKEESTMRSNALSRRHNVRQENKRPREAARQRLGGEIQGRGTANQAPAEPAVLADDLLIGAEAIAAYTGLSVRQVYYQQENLGLRHLGSTLIGSCNNLRALLTGRN